MTSLQFGENCFVVRLAGCYNVIEDAREFVARVLDGMECTETSTLSAIVLAEESFIIMKRLTRHRKNLSDAIFSFELRSTNFSSGAGSVFRTQVQPGRKTGGRRKIR